MRSVAARAVVPRFSHYLFRMPPLHSLIERAASPLRQAAAEAMVALAPIAPVMSEARVSSTQVSQLLAGHTAIALTCDGDWYRVRCGDGYEGWVHGGYLHSASNLGGLDADWFDVASLSLGARVSGPFGERDAAPWCGSAAR